MCVCTCVSMCVCGCACTMYVCAGQCVGRSCWSVYRQFQILSVVLLSFLLFSSSSSRHLLLLPLCLRLPAHLKYGTLSFFSVSLSLAFLALFFLSTSNRSFWFYVPSLFECAGFMALFHHISHTRTHTEAHAWRDQLGPEARRPGSPSNRSSDQ